MSNRAGCDPKIIVSDNSPNLLQSCFKSSISFTQSEVVRNDDSGAETRM